MASFTVPSFCSPPALTLGCPNCWRKSAVSIAEEKRNDEFMSSKWAHEALFELLSRRAEELDAEDAEESGSVIG